MSAAELDALCGWLRAAVRDRLDALRAASGGQPRRELDVLIETPLPAPAAAAPPIPAGLTALADRLELRADEQAVVAVLLAAALEPGLGAALASLFDPLGRDRVTRDAVIRVLGLPASHRLTAEDALARWRLTVERDGALLLDPAIEARLLGRPGRDAGLIEHLALIAPRPPLPAWPVAALADRVSRAVAAGARSVRLWLRGPIGSGRRTLFAAVAKAVGMVAAQFEPVADGGELVRAALRLARLEDLALAWLGPVRLPADLPPPAVQAWFDEQPPPPCPGVADLTVSMPVLDRSARIAAWTTLVPAFAGWSEPERAELVDGWSPRPGQLVAVALSGVTSAAEAAALLRANATQQLEGHCEILATPFDWDDLVVSDALLRSLRDIAFEARTLPRLWDEPRLARLFPQGRSITALFSGPPGSGKTMAAQVIARAIGLPLFRVDLSRIVSKYIGETSQNLSRILGAARHTDAVVFFDEADALFGRRTDVRDAHDRYANTETDYLLQAIDNWPGVALLATNKRGNIDPAFTRRMRVILEFAGRDASERLRLWKRLGASIMPEGIDALAPALGQIASAIELSGAQIKAALLTARLAAMHGDDAVSAEHLLYGIERELWKDGRSLDPRARSLVADA